jgi:hypothetical protein
MNVAQVIEELTLINQGEWTPGDSNQAIQEAIRLLTKYKMDEEFEKARAEAFGWNMDAYRRGETDY